jgi:hypothetical protein
VERIKHLLTHWGIHVAFGISLIVVGWTYWLSLEAKPVAEPGTMQPTELPLAYDLALAIIGAYLFNLLVVVLPAQKKAQSRFLALSHPLRVIANNGMDLIRDLEYLAECPPRRISEEHLRKVLKAVNDNPAIKAHIAERLGQAEAAYADIIPYAQDLPMDLQVCLQRENQNPMHEVFQQYRQPNYHETTTLNDLRRIGTRVLTVREAGEPRYRRSHLEGWVTTFIDYYLATEAVRDMVNKYTVRTRQQRLTNTTPKHGPYVYTFSTRFMEQGPEYVDYPPAATHDDCGPVEHA